MYARNIAATHGGVFLTYSKTAKESEKFIRHFCFGTQREVIRLIGLTLDDDKLMGEFLAPLIDSFKSKGILSEKAILDRYMDFTRKQQ